MTSDFEREVSIKLNQIIDYVDTVVDTLEGSKLIPNFKVNVVSVFNERLNRIYNLNGTCVMEMYNI
jgi:hypothetical protein